MTTPIQVEEIVTEAVRYAGSAIVGAGITYFFTARHFRKRKTYEFSERRLNDLYGPLCSRVEQLEADGKLKVAIYEAKDQAWKDKCRRSPAVFLDHEEAFAPYQVSIDYENRHFRDHVMPIYDEMLMIMNTQHHLAFQSTMTYYDAFYRFVELWHRWLDGAIPGEAIQRIEVSEEELRPLYTDIKARHAALVRKLAGDRKR